MTSSTRTSSSRSTRSSRAFSRRAKSRRTARPISALTCRRRWPTRPSRSSTANSSCAPARTRFMKFTGAPGRPCMEYQIKRASGLARRTLCKPEQYREAVDDVRLLLEGKDNELADELEARMLKASEELRFEQAAKYRDLLKTVRALQRAPEDDGDARSRHRHLRLLPRGAALVAPPLHHARGAIVGRREFYWEDIPVEGFDPAEFLGAVLEQYYTIGLRAARDSRAGRLASRELLEEALSEARAARADTRPAAGQEARDDRPRREERQARLRPALPRHQARLVASSRNCRRRSSCPSCPRIGSSRSTSRTSRGRRTSPGWSFARTER